MESQQNKRISLTVLAGNIIGPVRCEFVYSCQGNQSVEYPSQRG